MARASEDVRGRKEGGGGGGGGGGRERGGRKGGREEKKKVEMRGPAWESGRVGVGDTEETLGIWFWHDVRSMHGLGGGQGYSRDGSRCDLRIGCSGVVQLGKPTFKASYQSY